MSAAIARQTPTKEPKVERGGRARGGRDIRIHILALIIKEVKARVREKAYTIMHMV
jgi:hypothetical protein